MQNTLNCRGHLLDLSNPAVMGILNATPDSFFENSRVTLRSALRKAEKMLEAGAKILDIGGASSRPGAPEVSETEEIQRVLPILSALSKKFPKAILSVDTWRANVAQAAVESGAHIVNDISAGRLDPNLCSTAARLGTPYILMHMRGTPATMQTTPQYTDVTLEILDFFIAEIARLRALGIRDIVLDPGFGFGKTIEQNYRLLRELSTFAALDLPILVGLSRKSMIYKPLNILPTKALNGTSALHLLALQNGAQILRAHDVREALEIIQIWQLYAGETQNYLL